MRLTNATDSNVHATNGIILANPLDVDGYLTGEFGETNFSL